MSGVRLNCGFLSSTPVQQTLLVFVANLGYDFASLAYLFDVLAAGVLFTVASAAFVLGLVLDVRAANEALQDADLESAKLMSSRLWRRWLALIVNAAGGVLTLLGSIWYILGGLQDYDAEVMKDRLQFGDFLFAVGTWLFVLGFGLIIHDEQGTALAIAAAKGEQPPLPDAATRLAATYFACLVLFGVASTVYVFPSPATQYTGIGLLAVTNVVFTTANSIALVTLWRRHVQGQDVGEAVHHLDAAGLLQQKLLPPAPDISCSPAPAEEP